MRPKVHAYLSMALYWPCQAVAGVVCHLRVLGERPRPGLWMGLMSIPKDHTCSGCYCSECDRIDDNAAIDAILATRSQYRSFGPARGRRYLA